MAFERCFGKKEENNRRMCRRRVTKKINNTRIMKSDDWKQNTKPA